MSTRGSVGFIIDGEYKATYNHSDSYYGGLGDDIVNFIKGMNEINGWEQFKENARKVIIVSDGEVPTKENIKLYTDSGFANFDVGGPSPEPTWYQLLREAQGAEGLEAIYYGKVQHMLDGKDFIFDSLFCEYAYILNLDTMEFEIYDGFQEEAQEGNRFQKREDLKIKYFPCKLVKTMPLIINGPDFNTPEISRLKIDAILAITENRFNEARTIMSEIQSSGDIYENWYPEEDDDEDYLAGAEESEIISK